MLNWFILILGSELEFSNEDYILVAKHSDC